MSTMRAVVYDRPEHFEVREVPVPVPGPGEVLLEVLVAGVCGTDLHLHAGEFGPTHPLSRGQQPLVDLLQDRIRLPLWQPGQRALAAWCW